MGHLLLKRIEGFRKKYNLPILTLCKMMDVHNVTYHRWKSAGKIKGAYQKVVESFLEKNEITALNNTSDIAIIGIACCYPGASNIRELWENILSRRVQFRRMLDQRLPLSEYYNEDPKFPDKTYLTKAAFLENFQFDWSRLRIPKKTVESTDIAHWLALDTALKTFQDAGYLLGDIPLQNTGVIVGNTLTGEQTRSQTMRLRWPYVQKVLNTTLGHLGKSTEEISQIAFEMEKIYKSAFYPVTEDSLAGGLANTIAGRICNYLNFKGGGYIVDGACSSSLLAVATASDALMMGHLDLVIAGGVDISLDPFELVGFAKAGALAKDQMRVYDQKANGFLPGEGCGFVLLKRLKDAVHDKNYIYAVIKGWGISSDGHGGIMEPSSNGQSFAIGRAYKDLDYKISDIDFVEGHGTGTTKGDRVELEGIATAIDKTIKKEDKYKRGCGITSFKSIVGHTKAAAGIGGLIKAVLAVNQRILPPTANCKNPNDVFKDKARNLYPIILGGRLQHDKKARAGISSAGFGGINCHITIESKDEPKKDLKPNLDERALFVSHQETEVFVFTSRTSIHLKHIIQKFKEDLRNISIAEMTDLAALLHKKVKNHFPIKAAITTDSPEHLYEALILLENEIESSQFVKGAILRIKAKDIITHIILSNDALKSRIGFLYPGQGSQLLNMTRTLVHRYNWASDLFKLSNLPIIEKIYQATDKFLTKEEQEEFEKQLLDTRITQPAIVLSSLIWTEFFSKLGIEPKINIGHSLGELMAYYKNGALNKETLIKFAQLRGELMAADSNSSGSMVSLFCSKKKVEEMIAKLSGYIVIANINSPNQIVVSGGKKEIEKIKELAKKENISAYQLNVSNAFHSHFMKEASNRIKKTKILPEHLREYFSKQVISPVDFVGKIESALKECDLMIEIGPGRVLTDLVRAINKDLLCLPVESAVGNDRDLNIALSELFIRNIPIKWEELYKNRLIRTFVPASRKKFIENQCEFPLKINKQVLKNKFLQVPLQINEEPDQLENIIPGGLPEFTGGDKVAELLMAITHEITGFERESISLNLRLLDDLNLDSIKAAELIGKAARSLGIPGQIDSSQLSNHTLGQICDRLNETVAKAKTGLVNESTRDILKRYQNKTWVRNFALNFRPEEIKTKNVNQLKALKNIVILSPKNEENLIKKLENEFKVTKAKIQKIYLDKRNRKDVKTSPIHCLISIFPKNKKFGSCFNDQNEGSQQFIKESLKSIIGQLHQFTDLAISNRLGKDSFVILVQFGGGATSIASTLFLERPELKIRIIDFDSRIDDDLISQKIIDELQTYEAFNHVDYDSKLNRRICYFENSYPSEYKKRNISWSSKDLVLVTGGAKGITAQCALEFGRSTKAQMVLIGSSSLPDNKNNETNEIVQTLKRFEKENLKCSYYKCDVTNINEVFNIINEIEKKKGKITGFIHGAGLNSLKRLKQTSVQEVFSEALPKVIGAVNVCHALKDHPPKLIVGITSIIGLTGMEGSGWYGLSNEILNLYLLDFKVLNPNTEVVTIAYSVWDEVGMGAKLDSINRLAEKGIGAIPVKDGIKHFKQLVESDPGTQQIIVAARIAGISTWKSIILKANNFRFLEKIEYILPGIELVARTKLNIEDDPYLLDHNWKGTLLFPFVFGFEAMAQAVAYVLGIEYFDHIKAREINLQKPISVSEESGTTIEIHAQVLEKEKKNGHQEVRVEIYSQDTAFNEPHFSAIFEIEGLFSNQNKPFYQQIPKNIIDLNIQKDIYGPILFQGKLFQCIEQIHELYFNKEMKIGEGVFTSVYNKFKDEYLQMNKKHNNRFLIGDPFFIDSLLQTMQIIIPQDQCLPREIKEIKINLIRNDKNSKSYVHTKIEKIDMEYFKSDSEANLNGTLISIKECRLKVLDTILSNPSVNELANPTLLDQKLIVDKLRNFSNEIGFDLPVIKCLYSKNIENTKKEIRHKIETPIIKDAIKELLSLNKKSLKNLRIKWLESGKPIVEVNKDSNVGISISHIGPFLVVVSGYREQACDIEALYERNNENWRDVLGNEYNKIYENIDKGNFNKDFVGTSIWGLKETIFKTKGSIHNKFLINKITDDLIIYTTESDITKIVLSFKIKLRNERIVVLTFLLYKNNINIPMNTSINLLNSVGYNEDLFKLKIEYSGPQGQLVYVQRFPVTFKNTQNMNKSVYFSNYFDWIGEIREYSLYPVKKELTKLFETGKWGMATNYVKLHVLGEVKTDDVLESKFWINRISGDKNSVLDLMYEWFKLLPDGNTERVATSEQRVSWIQIVGHGEAKIQSFPEFLSKFISNFRPLKQPLNIFSSNEESYKNLNLGKELILFKKISKYDLQLSDEIFNTSLEESNLVGNIYFSNYAKWLGKIRDKFFIEGFPEIYLENGKKGEFICFNCEINHLMEAMPFDKIKLKMYLNKIYESGLDFYFEFFKMNKDKEGSRLAYASHKVSFCKMLKGKLIPHLLPKTIIEKLIND